MTTTSHSFIIGPRCGSDPGDYPQANYIFHAIARSVGFLVFVIICAVVAIVSPGESTKLPRAVATKAPERGRGPKGRKNHAPPRGGPEEMGGGKRAILGKRCQNGSRLQSLRFCHRN